MEKLSRLGIALLLAAAQIFLGSICFASNCDRLQRNIGPFGADGTASVRIPLKPSIRVQLRGLQDVRRILDTRLTDGGEQIVIYDSDANEYDPHPNVAVIVRGRVVKVFDERELNDHAGGFERYLASCEVNLTKNERGLAVAVSAGGDGAATAFAIIAWRSGSYRIIFNPMVGEGRIEFNALGLKVWDSVWGAVRHGPKSAGEEFECVWCPHRYAVTDYLWQNGSYVKAGSMPTRKKYDPAKITGASLLVR